MEMPSGILCIAIASASGIPTAGFSSVAKKVANPSGKLCAVMGNGGHHADAGNMAAFVFAKGGVLGIKGFVGIGNHAVDKGEAA